MIEPTEHNCGFSNYVTRIVKTDTGWHLLILDTVTDIKFCPYCGMDLTPGEYTIGSSLIAAERVRQVLYEGYSMTRDDNTHGELSLASIAYIVSSAKLKVFPWEAFVANPKFWWPFDPEYLKPKTPLKDLVRAGALLCAEIDRLWRTGERLEGKQ